MLFILFLASLVSAMIGFMLGMGVGAGLARNSHLPGDPDRADWWKRNDPPPFA